ncbi:MAG: hypothetical protein ACYDES_07155 [Acidimicrobiales bacterium]
MAENICVDEWLDRDQVLDHADLVVCHAGPRRASCALAAGVPPVMVPLFARLFGNARRITGAGRGSRSRSSRTRRTDLADPATPGVGARSSRLRAPCSVNGPTDNVPAAELESIAELWPWTMLGRRHRFGAWSAMNPRIRMCLSVSRSMRSTTSAHMVVSA